MADAFELRPDLDLWRSKLWELIKITPNLDWLLLTKRPENVQAMVPWASSWPSNVWLGATVENQEWAERRITHLLKIPARIRFLSCEPLLGPIDLSCWLDRVHWVIVGGESGPCARPIDPEWISAILQQTKDANSAFHFKQWGEWMPSDGQAMKKVGKKKAGREFRGRIWNDPPRGISGFCRTTESTRFQP
jgi:protein gp37